MCVCNWFRKDPGVHGQHMHGNRQVVVLEAMSASSEAATFALLALLTEPEQV